MSGRSVTVVAACVVVAGAVAGGVLYASDVRPAGSEGTGKLATVAEKAPPAPRWEAAGAVLDTAWARETAQTSVVALARTLESVAGDESAGGHVGAAVVDLASGELIFETNASDPFVPASTMKILTGTAALEVLGPDHRFVTSVTGRLSGDAEITLVGGGDPLLASSRSAAREPSAAGLDVLAERTAESLVPAGVTSVRLSFDDGLFAGPAVDPDWRPSYVPDGVAGPVNALAVDGARRSPGFRERVSDPAQATAELFAELLDDHGVEVNGAPRRTAADAADDEVASVTSPALSTVVEFMMRTSDNDVAEVLARHVALGLDRPGSSEEAAEAVTDALAGLGVEVDGLDIRDGSGLARDNAVTAGSLISALQAAAEPEMPHLRPVLAGLPVAGFTGTLAERVSGDSAGYVRAKTGTLTGVHSLAGLAARPDGQAYLFAILADDADDALAARGVLDDFAAVLVAE
ncbi:D-alanyl-D-alanine carboxypeptidase/D-alanyl-D-alanine-endopeptidase [Phytoactinopolyspora alkaliphila]|uniref:D-alanyl-D-alanine carboxypeptidase/D-alanyl-D-alanine-endopeptidase n=1 Tax=Phytoactinopolyspora alkaliphila TaxID=1783498 RepID=A0A6N9YM04_9ACTN|nr:D-alanyl-D-alanine carboxypeptidase/D-alanyl-D-alanine-endopeptidase [Phytoactinopolyspora alkaliphila]NED95995.1 D-alanyl-D-alanine carboxypeptidase/D-alanyl-D-alanine-endopeptidase [Phytoactinopolyspora alkaliphila]